MTDTSTGERLVISNEGGGGPLIELPESQVNAVKERLDRAGIPYSIDPIVISIEGEPPSAMINFSRYVDPARIQAALDEVL